MDFKPVRAEDKETINKYLKHVRSRSCDMSFAAIYLWRGFYNLEYAECEDMIVFRSNEEETSFSLPLGAGDPKKALDRVLEYCREEGIPPVFHSISREMEQYLNEQYPGQFRVEFDRDIADYIYETQALIELKGRKYHGKKNHINKFSKMYDWSYEAITQENTQECLDMLKKWKAQNCATEDLEKHPGEGYSSNSVIGRSGIESLYETELKGKDGCKIYIVDSEGNEKTTIAERIKEDGVDIRLTIDSDLQKALYEQFKNNRGCSIAMNPYTGEVLALVSTPSFDNNDFILGMSDEQWTALNENEDQPLYNRFRQVWCPGSTFKPVIAAIGLKTGTLDPNEDFGNEGLSWQKDSSWGSYKITTLHEYEPVIMKNALIYSDNIYFAKAALKIGADNLMNSLDEIGFNQEVPFEITMAESQYSNTDRIETEIQLADSGYGQGQILVNPLHLASIYTSFLNDGNIIQPYLQYSDNPAGKIWIKEAFSSETVSQVMEGLIGVVNDPNGTGYAAHRDDILLAGKTGTAELKESQEDTSGTEIGWFAVFTADKNVKTPILMISMVENVKGIGGSGYVVSKDKAVLDQYFSE